MGRQFGANALSVKGVVKSYYKCGYHGPGRYTKLSTLFVNFTAGIQFTLSSSLLLYRPPSPSSPTDAAQRANRGAASVGLLGDGGR